MHWYRNHGGVGAVTLGHGPWLTPLCPPLILTAADPCVDWHSSMPLGDGTEVGPWEVYPTT